MDNKELIKKLDMFLNKAWCIHSLQSARALYREIIPFIPEPYNRSISTEWGHVQMGHGIEQARLALKDEIELFKKSIDLKGR